jgi:ketosteroid isomerase-like protein
MLSLQEISDRLEIQQLMIDYSSAIDQRDYDRLDEVFTPDAYIDYRAMGGIDGRYPEVKAWLKPALAVFPHYCHMVGNMNIKVTGDTATARTICFNPMEAKLADGKTQVMFLGLWYVDQFVRTPKGWRISERVEESCYAHNVPPGIRVAEK